MSIVRFSLAVSSSFHYQASIYHALKPSWLQAWRAIRSSWQPQFFLYSNLNAPRIFASGARQISTGAAEQHHWTDWRPGPAIWNLAETRYRDMMSRYRYIPILNPISGTILQTPDIGTCPDIGIPGPYIRYTRYWDQYLDIPISGPKVTISESGH